MVYDRVDRVDEHDAALATHWYQLLKNGIHLKQGNPFEEWSADDVELPSSNPAQRHDRNNHRVLGFRPGTSAEYVHCPGILGRGYDGNGLTVDLWWAAETATSGSVLWKVNIERIHATHDIDTNGWSSTPGSVLAATSTKGAGFVQRSRITLTDGTAETDDLAIGEPYRLRVWRDGPDGSDDMAGDADLVRVVLFETPE